MTETTDLLFQLHSRMVRSTLAPSLQRTEEVFSLHNLYKIALIRDLVSGYI